MYINIYKQSETLIDLYPPFQVFHCISFSPNKPSIFAVGSTDGNILVFDLNVYNNINNRNQKYHQK